MFPRFRLLKKIKRRKYKILYYVYCIIITSVMFSYFNGPQYNPNNECVDTLKKNIRSDENYKTILIGSSYWGLYKTWQRVLTRHYNNQCPESRCIFHTNVSDIQNADAVLFNSMDLPYHSLIINFLFPEPRLKPPNQVWVFMSTEPPTNIEVYVNISQYNGYFNWTMTYRNDSDIFMPYGIVNKKKQEETRNIKDLIPYHAVKNNRYTAYWMASRCGSFSRREMFVTYLQRYIKVDKYGKCGKDCGIPETVPNMSPTSNNSENSCQTKLRKYTFYLALENAICKDYVTEKMFRALKDGLIPIVLGGAEYEKIAPPNSFINVQDFSSTRELAKYMNKILRNQKLYLRFHEWRRNYDIELGLPVSPMICGLCEKLHSGKIEKKVYTDLKDWALRQSHCTSWSSKLK